MIYFKVANALKTTECYNCVTFLCRISIFLFAKIQVRDLSRVVCQTTQTEIKTDSISHFASYKPSYGHKVNNKTPYQV